VDFPVGGVQNGYLQADNYQDLRLAACDAAGLIAADRLNEPLAAPPSWTASHLPLVRKPR
jgi:hypothetical protein